MNASALSELETGLRARRSTVWANRARPALGASETALGAHYVGTHDARARLERFAPLLASLFPELVPSGGRIDSDLRESVAMRDALGLGPAAGRLFVKLDHELPVGGSIKARGGIHAVLRIAEDVALANGLLEGATHASLVEPRAHRVFAARSIVVGSTGNLGLSVGTMASALGFRCTVHMSADARDWKKHRLRDAGVVVDADHPLIVHLPCGVGGVPVGIALGLHREFGKAVHCVFVEPVDAPCVALAMLDGDGPIRSVRDIGLSGRTEADGLAVPRASPLAARLAHPLVAGIVTVTDDELFELLHLALEREGWRLEPSAAAGFAGVRALCTTDAGARCLETAGLTDALPDAVHVVWTTGGRLVPDDEHAEFDRRGHRSLERRARSIAPPRTARGA